MLSWPLSLLCHGIYSEPGNYTGKHTSTVYQGWGFPPFCAVLPCLHLCGLQMWIQKGHVFCISALKIPVGFFNNGSFHAVVKV